MYFSSSFLNQYHKPSPSNIVTKHIIKCLIKKDEILRKNDNIFRDGYKILKLD